MLGRRPEPDQLPSNKLIAALNKGSDWLSGAATTPGWALLLFESMFVLIAGCSLQPFFQLLLSSPLWSNPWTVNTGGAGSQVL